MIRNPPDVQKMMRWIEGELAKIIEVFHAKEDNLVEILFGGEIGGGALTTLFGIVSTLTHFSLFPEDTSQGFDNHS